MDILILLILIGSSIWVFIDAKNLGVRKVPGSKSVLNLGPGGWLACSLLLWIVAFPLYLINRAKFKEQFASSAPSGAGAGSAAPHSIDQQLRAFAKLRDDGVISAAEFDQKKKSILGL